MAAGIRSTTAEVLLFVDSDSSLESDAVRKLVQAFADPRVGAVCSHAEIRNVNATWLTRMQAVRYFVAFRAVKAAESLFGTVTCCSGCCSAYRREALVPRLSWWENQSFLGRPSTYGDDRSLTNCVMRDWRVVYHSQAISCTIAPETVSKFVRQQLRWKRSWTRESLIISRFIWRKHPLASLTTYLSIVLPLVAPVAAVRALFWHPLLSGAGAPWIYLTGIYAMALVYGLYYAYRKADFSTLWLYGIAFALFYLVCMLWLTYYAIVTCRASTWGTRGPGDHDEGRPSVALADARSAIAAATDTAEAVAA